jgi:hypothetical protein
VENGFLYGPELSIPAFQGTKSLASSMKLATVFLSGSRGSASALPGTAAIAYLGP